MILIKSMFKKILMVLAIISFSFFSVSASQAWDYGLEDAGKGGGYKTSGSESELLTIVNTSVTIGLSLIAVVFLAMMFYAGLRWMTARGNEELVEKARNALIAGAIGFIIVVASYGISTFIFDSMLTKSANTISTTECCCDITKGKGQGECKTIYTSKDKCTQANTNLKVEWLKNEDCNSAYKTQ